MAQVLSTQDSENSLIGIREEEITVDGEAIVIRVLNLGQGDVMTVAGVAEMFGVTAAGLRSIIRDQKAKGNDLVVRDTHDQELTDLKAAGVLPFKTTVVNLLPKATIRDLAKVINTPQAWAAFRQVWADSEALRTGGTAGVDPAVIALIQKTVDEHDATLATVLDAMKVTLDVATKLGTRVSALENRGVQAAFARRLPVEHPDYPRLDAQLAGKVDRAIRARIRKLGFGGEYGKKLITYLMHDLKYGLLPDGMASTLTFKHIKPEQVPAAMEFIANWQPK